MKKYAIEDLLQIVGHRLNAIDYDNVDFELSEVIDVQGTRGDKLFKIKYKKRDYIHFTYYICNPSPSHKGPIARGMITISWQNDSDWYNDSFEGHTVQVNEFLKCNYESEQHIDLEQVLDRLLPIKKTNALSLIEKKTERKASGISGHKIRYLS